MKPTHQSIQAPYLDVVACRLDQTSLCPSWCANIRRVGDHYEATAKDGARIIAYDGDWAVAVVGECMVILTHEEFTRLFRWIPKLR